MPDTPAQHDPERLDLDSASAFARTVACPGWKQLRSAIAPEDLAKANPEDPDATRGTKIHKAFETGNILELSEEETEDYKKGEAFNEEIVQSWMTDFDLPGCEEQQRELRLWIHDTNLNPIASAKMDRHYLADGGTHLCIIDLKSGWVPNLAPAPSSWQLKVQAIAAWREYGVSHIRVGFTKPKVYAGSKDVADYDLNDLRFSDDAIRFHVWQSQQAQAPRHPGEHCNHCPCKAFCPEAAAFAMLPLGSSQVFTPVTPAHLLTLRGTRLEGAAESLVSYMSTENLFKLWLADNAIRKILDAVDTRLKSLTPEQLASLGLKLPEKGRSMNTIKDVKGAFNFIQNTLMATEQQAWRTLEMSKYELTSLIVALKGCTRLDAGKFIGQEMAEFIERKYAKPPLQRA
jgi:hypothetical protein